MTLLDAFDPLVLNVPVRKTKEGSKVEALTVMFRWEFHITGTSWRTQRRVKLDSTRESGSCFKFLVGSFGIFHIAFKVVYTFCSRLLDSACLSCLSCFSWFKKCKVEMKDAGVSYKKKTGPGNSPEPVQLNIFFQFPKRLASAPSSPIWACLLPTPYQLLSTLWWQAGLP